MTVRRIGVTWKSAVKWPYFRINHVYNQRAVRIGPQTGPVNVTASFQTGENLMRLTYVVCVLAAFSLAACESLPEVNSNASGSGSSGAPATGGQQSGAPSSAVESQRVAGPAAGSVEDFVVNVGDRVQFGFDRFDLTAEARTVIENQVIWLKRYPGINVTIEGHADERGTREYNLALGERRANSVRDYMLALGIGPARVKTISYGKERPVDPASTEDAWARNRRAVTVVDGATG